MASQQHGPRPLLAGLTLAGVAAVTKQTAGLAFAVPAPRELVPSRSGAPLAEGFRGSPTRPLHSQGGPEGNSATAALAAFAAAGIAAFQARSQCRASSSDDRMTSGGVVQPDSELPRTGRPKGQQNLPLGQKVQRFFSVHNRHYWDYVVNPRNYFMRKWLQKDLFYAIILGTVHFGALFAPFYFTWKAFATFLIGYLITGLFGITLSYHRQLAHRSFKTPKWLEYTFAYCGALALQSHPINWVSSHRHHHGGCETEKDVHSPLDGFWWSHTGWLLDQNGTWMRANKRNAADLTSQWFYRFLQKTYVLHAIVLPIAGLYAFGGLPCVFWGFFARVCWVWHITWAVNSVSHVWGFQDWNTGDNSMNNWLIGILAFGEGWHNNHHAFETSCRHGLKWWQVDFTWYTVKFLSFLGLAKELKYPSPSKQKALAMDRAAMA